MEPACLIMSLLCKLWMQVSLNFCWLFIILKIEGSNQGISQVNKDEENRSLPGGVVIPHPDGSLKIRHLPGSVPDLGIFTDHQRVILY